MTSVVDSAPNNGRSVTYGYDDNGNTIEKTDSGSFDISFAYDSLNRLVQAKQTKDGSLLGLYDYDANNLRIRHQKSDRGDVDYFYDGHSVIEERNAADNSLLAHYSYTDRMLALATADGNQYYHQDALGSTVNLTDATGAVQVGYVLDPWGHIDQQHGGSVNRQVFTAKEKDANTGLIYFGQRYYDPDTARFITEDSYLGKTDTPPSLHRYLYAYSNPTVYIDLLGYESVSVDKKGNVYWQVEEDHGLYKTPVGKPFLVGKKTKDTVYLTKEFGGGKVDYVNLKLLAAYNFARREGAGESLMNPRDISGLKVDRQKYFIRKGIDDELFHF